MPATVRNPLGEAAPQSLDDESLLRLDTEQVRG
jgi:hypothetical protein